MDQVEKAIAAITEQQKAVRQRGPQWMVAEQLKDICRREPASAEILLQDLTVRKMSIMAAEKKIKAFADKQKVGDFAGVTGAEAEEILREFYGLPKAGQEVSGEEPAVPKGDSGLIDLTDFL